MRPSCLQTFMATGSDLSTKGRKSRCIISSTGQHNHRLDKRGTKSQDNLRVLSHSIFTLWRNRQNHCNGCQMDGPSMMASAMTTARVPMSSSNPHLALTLYLSFGSHHGHQESSQLLNCSTASINASITRGEASYLASAKFIPLPQPHPTPTALPHERHHHHGQPSSQVQMFTSQSPSLPRPCQRRSLWSLAAPPSALRFTVCGV